MTIIERRGGRTHLFAIALPFAMTLLFAAVPFAQAQSASPTPPAQSAPTPAPPVQRSGGFVPGQHRAPGDPVQIERGKTLYSINCNGCHGPDLRGGDMGGPNLLRSQVALSDQNGELILPIIQGSRRNMGMPAIEISPADGLAVAAYVRSVMETIGRQGTPPSAALPPPSILVGNAQEGHSYFAAKCSTCHSVTGDLQGIATRIADPKSLQNAWVSGGARGRRGAPPEPGEANKRIPTVAVTLPSGEHVDGTLVRIDDFLVSLALPDSTIKSFSRTGGLKVELHDPMQGHRDLWEQMTDKDMHDVTAYLVTLK